jgi:RNA polymerase sigma factor (sigma-70 family)
MASTGAVDTHAADDEPPRGAVRTELQWVMASELPPELAFLDDRVDEAGREEGWSRFVGLFTPLLMRTAREFGTEYDDRMDRYRYVLDALREDGFRRLRSFRPVSGSSVAAWIVVVSRRLCLDFERHNSGRPRGENPNDSVQARRRLRRALAKASGGDFDPGDRLPSASLSPEEELREQELHQAVDNALRRLTPRQQLVIRLRFEDGLSVGEVGEVLGMRNVFQVYRLLRAALGDARKHLEQSGVRDAHP